MFTAMRNELDHLPAIRIFQEQIEWAVEEGADYIIGETFNDFGEALLALKSIQKYGKGKVNWTIYTVFYI